MAPSRLDISGLPNAKGYTLDRTDSGGPTVSFVWLNRGPYLSCVSMPGPIDEMTALVTTLAVDQYNRLQDNPER